MLVKHAYAVCPVCTVAVAGGIGLSRWIGIDDTITGLWIGGLIFSSGLWLANWINSKHKNIHYSKEYSILLMALVVVIPLVWAKIIGQPGNTLWAIDKLVLGMLFGSFVFITSVWLDMRLRTINDSKVYVYYQKVIIPVFLLIIASLFFFFIT